VERRLHEWSRGFRRVRLRRAVVVTPDDPARLDELRTAIERHGLATQPSGETLLVMLPVASDDDRETALSTALREAGFTPQWDTRIPVTRQRADEGKRSEADHASDRRRREPATGQ
jgi:hypothetical protein